MNYFFPACSAIFRVLLLMAAISTAPYAQAIAQPAEPEGTVGGLQFQINPLLSFSGISDADLSYSFSHRNNRYTRVGLTLMFEYEMRSAETSETQSEPDIRTYDLMTRLHYTRIFRTEPNGSVSFYGGAGPQVGFGYLNRNTERDSFNSGEEQNARAVEAGLRFVTGVEWFVLSNLSITGEYGINLLYTYERTEDFKVDPTGSERSRMTSNGILFGRTGARLGVSVYF